ncbi:MAG: cell division protein FtsA [Candidatus Gracilibacteria bacterium]|nr:cell division protein FtsA [Candidatus Gracilibacteria bacterium]
MVSGEVFTAIDIGTAKIKTVIATFTEDKKLRVLGVGIAKSNGIRKGNIIDMDEFKKNIDDSLSEAERMTGEQVSAIYLSLSGTNIEVVTNNGIISVPHGEVSNEDVNRVLDMSQNGVDLMNKVVLKVIPESFTLDMESGVKNPVGMSAKKLEVRSHIFCISSNILSNIKKGIYDVGVDILDIYPNVLSAPEAVLSKRQKELGVVCIDIGASTTDVAVFEEGSLIFAAVIPIGGEHVTSDIALGARVSIDTAEKLKIEYGSVGFCKEEKAKDDEIDLAKISKNETTTISRKYLSEIIRARYSEIFYYVNNELKKIGKDGMLPEGAVISGGGAKARDLNDLAKEVLRLPSMIGTPEDSDFISGTSIGDPIFAGIIGTLLLSQKYGVVRSGFKLHLSVNGFFGSIKNALKKIMP